MQILYCCDNPWDSLLVCLAFPPLLKGLLVSYLAVVVSVMFMVMELVAMVFILLLEMLVVLPGMVTGNAIFFLIVVPNIIVGSWDKYH